jgi:hypothetical protein
MFDYLVDNALKNVWCAPAQDRQDIFQLARLTPDGGAMNTVQVGWKQYDLPSKGVYFHVYQIGQISPHMVGLLSNATTWTTFSSAMNANNLIVDVYTNEGLQMPRFLSYFMVTKNKNLIVAVQFESPIAVNLDTDALFLRLYSNAFFQSPRATLGSTKNYIETAGVVPAFKNDILNLQNKIAVLASKPGAVYAFVNGYKVDQVNVLTAQVGDVVEYVYDSSVYKVVDFPFLDLPTFNSTLDNKFKYLLHYNGTSDNTVDFEDDVDVWIYYTFPSGFSKGLYYHHNRPDALRNVTHRDYSLPTAYVAGFVADQNDWVAAAQVTIRLHIRKAGFARPLAYESNRIMELYKLPDAGIVSAMTGANATLDNWKAATLEASSYVQIMGAQPATRVTRQLVEDAYGYNATSQLVGNSPLVPTKQSGQLIVTLPYNLQSNSSAWEYDSEGTLLGYYNHASGGVYTCHNSTCALVEMYAGTAGQQLDDTYGIATQTINPALDYRMYTCPINPITGKPTYAWEDVTGSSQYSIVGTLLTWSTDPTKVYTCVRSNKVMLAYTLYIQPQEGYLPIQIQQEGIRNYILQLFAMQIPMGQLDVFVNGRSMISGLDYVMQFPTIMINNVSALDFPQDKQQQITIRWSGFCNSDLTPRTYSEVGWVQYGLLSNNNRYNIRDDDVTRIVMGGGVYPKSALKFAENSADVLGPQTINGQPYQIQKVVVPMLGVTNEDTYEYLEKAIAVDKAVEDYMTLYYPLPTASGPDTITELYPVFSPFCCKIIYDLVLGIIDETPLKQFYNDAYVKQVCAPYEYLLAYDPTQTANRPDTNFVAIRPHNLTVSISLDLYAYNFLNHVIRIYLNGLVQLNNFVSIASISSSSSISSS